MKRGDIVTVVLPANLGKPRPALVLQSDFFAALTTVTLVPLTSRLVQAPLIRIDVPPGESTGLKAPSQLMIDKVSTVAKRRVGRVLGRADERTLRKASQALALFTGLN